jgi:succinyl-CoA synthetase beta subunit
LRSGDGSNIRLLEYESKNVFRKHGLPLLDGILIYPSDDAEEKANQFEFPAIVKAQIAIGSRKKAGLIKVAKTKEDAITACTEFFKTKIAGFPVEAILIEELASIEHEYYCSITLDASGRQFYLIASAEGGIDIENVAKTKSDAIIKEHFSISNGLTRDLATSIAWKLNLNKGLTDSMTNIFLKLWEITLNTDALLTEINPLVLTPSGFFAVDGKMILDDNAILRQPLIEELQKKKLSDLEKLAKEGGFSFVELEGNIAILANGAGLTMALIDILAQFGLNPANFLDVGGGANKERVLKALKLLFKLKPMVILINIFGGITRCDIVAQAILQALKTFKEPPPMVIRLTGTNEKEGIFLLKEQGIEAFQDVMEAIDQVKLILGEN